MRECVLCHGQNGDEGTAESANLKTSMLSIEQISETIKTGRAEMPPFDYLNESEIKRIANYTKSFQLNER